MISLKFHLNLAKNSSLTLSLASDGVDIWHVICYYKHREKLTNNVVKSSFINIERFQMKKSLLLAVLFTFCATFSFAQTTGVTFSSLSSVTNDSMDVYFNLGYSDFNGTPYTGRVDKIVDVSADANASFLLAVANGDEMMCRGTSGLSSVIANAVNYPSVLGLVPSGSNTYQSEYTGDVTTCPLVVTGAGDGVHNLTAFFIEFHGKSYSNIAAYANARVAGQMAFLTNYGAIKHTPAEVRALARAYGKSLPLNSDGFNDGYGIVDVATIVASAMPVELTSFTASLAGKNVVLNWKTATETNNYGFEIERTDAVSKQWNKVGFVAGSGNSNSTKEYSFVDKSNQSGTVQYRLKQIDRDGKFEYHKQVEVTLETVANFDLAQNFPNPFNPATEISFNLPSSNFVSLKIYDMLGREVATLLSEEMSAGVHQVKFDGSKLSSGNYIYQISAGSFTAVKRMVLLK